MMCDTLSFYNNIMGKWYYTTPTTHSYGFHIFHMLLKQVKVYFAFIATGIAYVEGNMCSMTD